MKLSEIKNSLNEIDEVKFILPNGTFVPKHFHVTEVGLIERKFIDCGGVKRSESVINFQLWFANDTNHRLEPSKLISIIDMAERELGLTDLPIEVEYQGETIGRFGLEEESGSFLLTAKQTDCLAQDACGIPVKEKLNLADLSATSENSCTPGGGCC